MPAMLAIARVHRGRSSASISNPDPAAPSEPGYDESGGLIVFSLLLAGGRRRRFHALPGIDHRLRADRPTRALGRTLILLVDLLGIAPLLRLGVLLLGPRARCRQNRQDHCGDCDFFHPPLPTPLGGSKPGPSGRAPSSLPRMSGFPGRLSNAASQPRCLQERGCKPAPRPRRQRAPAFSSIELRRAPVSRMVLRGAEFNVETRRSSSGTGAA